MISILLEVEDVTRQEEVCGGICCCLFWFRAYIYKYIRSAVAEPNRATSIVVLVLYYSEHTHTHTYIHNTHARALSHSLDWGFCVCCAHRMYFPWQIVCRWKFDLFIAAPCRQQQKQQQQSQQPEHSFAARWNRNGRQPSIYPVNQHTHTQTHAHRSHATRAQWESRRMNSQAEEKKKRKKKIARAHIHIQKPYYHGSSGWYKINSLPWRLRRFIKCEKKKKDEQNIWQRSVAHVCRMAYNIIGVVGTQCVLSVHIYGYVWMMYAEAFVAAAVVVCVMCVRCWHENLHRRIISNNQMWQTLYVHGEHTHTHTQQMPKDQRKIHSIELEQKARQLQLCTKNNNHHKYIDMDTHTCTHKLTYTIQKR